MDQCHPMVKLFPYTTLFRSYTNASRMSVFVYLAPPLTALGVHFFVPGERLVLGQWLGVALAFAGLVLAFAEGFFSGQNTCDRKSTRLNSSHSQISYAVLCLK